MKDSMRSRLEQLARRLVEADAMLAEPEIASNMDEFRKLSRERAEAIAYYTDDREDAWGTAEEMARDAGTLDGVQKPTPGGS